MLQGVDENCKGFSIYRRKLLFSHFPIKLFGEINVQQLLFVVMKIEAFFFKVIEWLKSPEVFGKISKKIPGKWLLFEYYIDSKDALLNFKAEALKEDDQSMSIEFFWDETFIRDCNLPVTLFQNIESGSWSISKNFITLIHPKDFRKNVELQFAFEKSHLKLLKKDSFGKIEFFGFFEKVISKK